jgi:hypothetical protein
LTRSNHPAIVLAVLISLECGCGSSSSSNAEATKNNTVPAAADRRIKFKPEYKDMIGSDGKMKFIPSQSTKKRP